ncbi:MAG: hypothetical protein ACL7BU_10185 [Candidatus Phlomobacter fragariae]
MWISTAFHLKVIRTFDKAISIPIQPLTDKVQAGLAMLAFYKHKLRIAPSGLLGAMKRLQSSLGMPDILPAYAVNAQEGCLTGSSEVTHSFTVYYGIVNPTTHHPVLSVCNY